ncbi:hypothetical protein [Hamadaea tsunoensis]|uniref:hypothetical protein n=1 Tax=Hamadaea tsunoensis TaxID=53368 RepID=UPI00040BFDA8|nr:hypothetical protein [Hamadaea tsunoensis]
MISVADPLSGSGNAAGDTGSTAEPTDVLDRLLWQDAQHLLARHTPLDGLDTPDDACSWCGHSWPCPPRRLAERAAAASTRTWQQAWTVRHDLNSLRALPSMRTGASPAHRGAFFDS